MIPFFSIIIPVYNVAPYLHECLDSVLAQTFTDWEAICVDDGSTDGSGAILDEYAERDSRFRVVHQPNAGVSAARNRGLDEMKGEWICFLDADDVWDERFLSTFSSAIAANPDEKCFRVGYEKFNEGVRWRGNNEVVKPFYRIDISNSISMRDFYSFFFYCYSYQRDLFDGIRFPQYIRGEDRCVLNKIQIERIDSIMATETGLYGYRQRIGSAMNTVPSKQVLLDEMDHRLDIMEMIDGSHKTVRYSGDRWLEKYFTTTFYGIVSYESGRKIFPSRRERIVRFRKVNGISLCGRLIAILVSVLPFYWMDFTICCLLPKLYVKVKRLLGNGCICHGINCLYI